MARKVDAGLSLTTDILSYTAAGLPETIRDENGVVTTLTYYPRGWLKSRSVATASGASLTSYEYDDVGQLKRLVPPNGAALNYEYDDAHRLTDIFTDDGERIKYEVDLLGNNRIEKALTSSAEVRMLQQREFDDLGRLWKVLGVDGQEVQKNGYDENGNLTPSLTII